MTQVDELFGEYSKSVSYYQNAYLQFTIGYWWHITQNVFARSQELKWIFERQTEECMHFNIYSFQERKRLVKEEKRANRLTKIPKHIKKRHNKANKCR